MNLKNSSSNSDFVLYSFQLLLNMSCWGSFSFSLALGVSNHNIADYLSRSISRLVGWSTLLWSPLGWCQQRAALSLYHLRPSLLSNVNIPPFPPFFALRLSQIIIRKYTVLSIARPHYTRTTGFGLAIRRVCECGSWIRSGKLIHTLFFSKRENGKEF